MSDETRVGWEALEAVLVAHQRRDIGSCLCGWGVDTGDLGRSHAAHVADAVLALIPAPHPQVGTEALRDAARDVYALSHGVDWALIADDSHDPYLDRIEARLRALLAAATAPTAPDRLRCPHGFASTANHGCSWWREQARIPAPAPTEAGTE